MEPQIIVTHEKLVAAFKLWEDDNRNGKCMDAQAMASLTSDELAETSAKALIAHLENVK